jgi:DNA-binding PadR family transcriptional regulator
MGGASISAVPLGMVALRLLIEEPDSRSGLAARVKDEFASARWSPSAVHNACNRLVAHGWVRPMDRDVGREVVRLEATRGGREHYEQWRRCEARGRLRDNVSAGIRLCRNAAEVHDLVVWLRAQEDICDDDQAEAKERLLVHGHRAGRRRGVTGGDFASAREELALVDEVVHWELEAERICRLRQKLEAWLAGREPAGAGETEESGDGRAAVS